MLVTRKCLLIGTVIVLLVNVIAFPSCVIQESTKDPPQITLVSDSIKITPKLGNYSWLLEDNTVIEEKYFDMLKYGYDLEPVEVLPDEEIVVDCDIDPGGISLLMIIDGEPFGIKGDDKLSFFPPNEIGTYIYYIKCNWGKEIYTSYVFKLKVNEQIKLIGDIEEIINKLKTLGSDIEIRKIADNYLFVNPVMVKIGEEQINIYKYKSEEEIEFQKSLIRSSGCTISTPINYREDIEKEDLEYDAVEITWVSYPHFYTKDDLIAFYCGENEAILEILDEIFGEVFAGHKN